MDYGSLRRGELRSYSEWRRVGEGGKRAPIVLETRLPCARELPDKSIDIGLGISAYLYERNRKKALAVEKNGGYEVCRCQELAEFHRWGN